MRRVLGGVVLALVVTACGGAGSTPPTPPASTPPAPLDNGLQGATASNILALWKPSYRHGQRSLAFVKFSLGGIWSGSDGCNAFNGRYTLGEGGALTASSGPTTLIGCENWPGPTWVGEASRAAVEGNRLLLFDQTGKRLGVMVRSVPKAG
jgi:heat shock protein HslJ